MPPTFIFLPGLHGTADLFDPLVAQLPTGLPRRVLAYPTDRPHSYDEHLQRVETQLRDATDLILFAESFSGPLAIKFAAAHQDRVRALILCGTFVTNPVPRILSYLATPMILIRFPIPSFAIRLFLAGSKASTELVRQTRREIRKNTPWALAHRVQQAAWLDARAALAACRVPMLCLAGTRDRLIGPRALRRICRLRPDIPVRTIDGPHMLLETCPAEVWRHVETFLDGLWSDWRPTPAPLTQSSATESAAADFPR